jgi:hypothetical protein
MSGETDKSTDAQARPTAILAVLRRASALISPELSPFRAIWDQWDDQKDRGARQLYLEVEKALKQALADLGERDVPEFARSGDRERYATALRKAIALATRWDSAANEPAGDADR